MFPPKLHVLYVLPYGLFGTTTPFSRFVASLSAGAKKKAQGVHISLRPVTIAKSESREVGFFSDFRHPKFFSGTIGNSLIREVGSTILVGTWNENPDITAYSGFFVFSDRYIALYVPTSDFFSSSRKWQIRLEIFKKVGFFRLFVAIVLEYHPGP